MFKSIIKISELKLNETSINELINLMKKFFDKSCFGSVELLKGRDLDKLAHNIKYNVKDYTDISNHIEYFKEDDKNE